MTRPFVLILGLALVGHAISADGQERILSPRGQASTQVAGHYTDEGTYTDGRWIDVDYGRPILRGRTNPFGGEPYGSRVVGGAPVWRVGADQSTRFNTEVALRFGDEDLPAGDYSMFIELREQEWTLIFSSFGVKQWYLENTPNALWGSFGYTTEHDVLRTRMTVETFPVAADQLIIAFTDMTQEGGNLTIWWDNQFATAPFEVKQ